MGLKYFAGTPEDHLNTPFAGINGQYGEKTLVTFGRRELLDLLHKAGFSRTELLIPLPDYKLPITVLHPASFDGSEPGMDIAALAAHSVPYDVQMYRSLPTSSLKAAYRGITNNGLLPDMCNSFFFIAANGSEAPIFDDTLLASHYGGRRLSAFAKETRFIRREGKIRVERKLLDPRQQGCLGGMRIDFPEVEDYVPHESYLEPLVTVVNRPGWTAADIAFWATPWIRHLTAMATANEKGEQVLPPECLDMLPKNLLVGPEKQLSAFDLEWREESGLPVPLFAILFRGLYICLRELSSVAPPESKDLLDIIPLILRVLALSGAPMTPKKVDEALEHCAAFSARATGGQLSLEQARACRLRQRLW